MRMRCRVAQPASALPAGAHVAAVRRAAGRRRGPRGLPRAVAQHTPTPRASSGPTARPPRPARRAGRAAEPLASSPAVARLSALAVERCAIVFGVAEEAEGRVYDTVALADAEGGVRLSEAH